MKRNEFRIDLSFENISDDPSIPEYVIVPDPTRYEYFNDGTREGYRDMLDPRRMVLSVQAMAKAIQHVGFMPLNDLQPLIDDSDEYIASRRAAIREGLQRGTSELELRDATDEEQHQNVGSKTDFVIMSLDLIGSTKLSQGVDGETFANIITTFSSEVAKMCYRFHGRPLKFMGDGGLLYFPLGTQARRHDMAMDCALSLRDLILEGMNPILSEMSLPTLACRFGIDSGEVFIRTIGDSATTNHTDIIGEVVSIATKIEKAAPKNGICVGESVVINTHTMWMQHMKPVRLPDDWPYIDRSTDKPYPIYILNIPAERENPTSM